MVTLGRFTLLRGNGYITSIEKKDWTCTFPPYGGTIVGHKGLPKALVWGGSKTKKGAGELATKNTTKIGKRKIWGGGMHRRILL